MVQRHALHSFMRPAARRALKLALRMHLSSAVHPSAALSSPASKSLAAGINSSSPLAKTAWPHLGCSKDAVTAKELGELRIKRSHMVSFSGTYARRLRDW